MHSKFERILQISLGVIDNRAGEYYLEGVRGCSHTLTQQLNRQLATVLQDTGRIGFYCSVLFLFFFVCCCCFCLFVCLICIVCVFSLLLFLSFA
jgi:hypothetical protein